MKAPFGEGRLLAMVAARHRPMFAASLIASTVNAAATVLLIGSIKSMIDGSATATPKLALLIAVVLLVIMVTQLASGAWISRVCAGQMAKMRRSLAAALAATDYEQIERIGQHRIYAAFTEDLPKIARGFGALPAVMLNTGIVICGLLYLGAISLPHLLILMVLIGCALLVSERVLLRRMQHYNAVLREAMNHLYRHIQGLVFGSKEMRLNAERELFFRERLFERSVEEIETASRRHEAVISAYNSWSATVVLMLLAGILWLSQAWLPMQPDQMIAFALVLMFLRGPVIAIVNNVPHLASGDMALKNLRSLGLARGSTRPVQRLHRAGQPWRELVLDQVSYAYQSADGNQAFRMAPLSLTIYQGEVLFITGGNGSGKSTLAKLITGLYQPTEGEIRCGGVRVTSLNREAYRAQFSAVFGDYYLFHEVLDEHGELVEDGELTGMLETYGLTSKVRAERGQWSTIELSQGQRKRLALIASLAEERPILVLDEWAAEQDPEFRRVFYTELIPAFKAAGKTIIAITHDDHYFHTADRVLKLDQGQVQSINPVSIAPTARLLRLSAAADGPPGAR
jgi:multidrug/microcin transport system ATP-binding/permease protein